MVRPVAQIDVLPENASNRYIRGRDTLGYNGVRNDRSHSDLESFGASRQRDPLQLKDKINTNLENNKRKVREFYEKQNDFINMCLESTNQTEAVRERREAQYKREMLKVKIASYGSLAINILLFGLQLYTAITSKSLSLFATMADSFMDLLSSATLVYAGWVARSKSGNSYEYPAGKRRVLGVGIVIFSSLMVGLSIELLIESIRGLTSRESGGKVTIGNIICIAIALATKFGMLWYCWAIRHHSEARIFARDHFNDLILNAFGLIMSIVGTHIAWYVDPIGGLAIGLYIMYSWASEAIDQAKLLVGTTADPQFLNQLTYMSMVHDPRVQYVDTVRAYHIGEEKYVEIDIVMDENTPLYESHDVGEALQILVEKQEGVQRAHVHIDFDFQHPPEHHPKSQ